MFDGLEGEFASSSSSRDRQEKWRNEGGSKLLFRDVRSSRSTNDIFTQNSQNEPAIDSDGDLHFKTTTFLCLRARRKS